LCVMDVPMHRIQPVWGSIAPKAARPLPGRPSGYNQNESSSRGGIFLVRIGRNSLKSPDSEK
jgi:hypothetical protein